METGKIEFFTIILQKRAPTNRMPIQNRITRWRRQEAGRLEGGHSVGMAAKHTLEKRYKKKNELPRRNWEPEQKTTTNIQALDKAKITVALLNETELSGAEVES